MRSGHGEPKLRQGAEVRMRVLLALGMSWIRSESEMEIITIIIDAA